MTDKCWGCDLLSVEGRQFCVRCDEQAAGQCLRYLNSLGWMLRHADEVLQGQSSEETTQKFWDMASDWGWHEGNLGSVSRIEQGCLEGGVEIRYFGTSLPNGPMEPDGFHWLLSAVVPAVRVVVRFGADHKVVSATVEATDLQREWEELQIAPGRDAMRVLEVIANNLRSHT